MTFRSAMATLWMAALWLATPVQAGEVTHHKFASDILGRDYAYTLYRPDGYHETNRAYPVLYLLHGSFGNERDWVDSGNLKQTADRMIREGLIPPMVIVMPGSESWWIDGHNEAARSAFLDELLPYVEATWQVVPRRQWRAIGGLSAGGYGTLNFMLERPDLFAAAAALSPASYHPLPPRHSSARRHPAFLDQAGAFDEALWQRSNYTAYLDRYLERGEVVPLYLSAGHRDAFNAEHHARLVRQALAPHQPEQVTLEVLNGGHTWHVWRASLPNALAWMGRYLQGPVPLETLAADMANEAEREAAPDNGDATK